MRLMVMVTVHQLVLRYNDPRMVMNMALGVLEIHRVGHMLVVHTARRIGALQMVMSDLNRVMNDHSMAVTVNVLVIHDLNLVKVDRQMDRMVIKKDHRMEIHVLKQVLQDHQADKMVTNLDRHMDKTVINRDLNQVLKDHQTVINRSLQEVT